MAKQKKRTPKKPIVLQLLRGLKNYVDSVSAARGKAGKVRLYSSCIHASFTKCYEFNVHAWNDDNTKTAFFYLPTLRGICEDLIFLNCIQKIPHDAREDLVSDLMHHELHDRLGAQSVFFKNNRPQQLVLKPELKKTQLNLLENNIRDIWRAHGWPRIDRTVIPPIRQMAEKHGGGTLTTLYDYLYRLTSDTVHFNVNALLRTGWGKDMSHFTFSTTHFNLYYQMTGRIYGTFMFCSYFELFARFLRTDDDTKATVNAIRKAIFAIPRWPEMITPEQMNIEPPAVNLLQIMISAMQARKDERLLKK